MKICSKCGESKPLDSFSKNSRNKDGRHPWCKLCFAEYERERYKNGDSVRKLANKAKIKLSNRDKLWSILTQSQCVDCGETDPIVLEFDHLDPAEKEYNIADLMSSITTWSKIQREIDKCEIVCANCHRRRTYSTFGSWRLTQI